MGGSVYNPDGIDPDHLKAHLEANKGSIKGYQAPDVYEDEASIYRTW